MNIGQEQDEYEVEVVEPIPGLKESAPPPAPAPEKEEVLEPAVP